MFSHVFKINGAPIVRADRLADITYIRVNDKWTLSCRYDGFEA
jgi:hypothetical protein